MIKKFFEMFRKPELPEFKSTEDELLMQREEELILIRLKETERKDVLELTDQRLKEMPSLNRLTTLKNIVREYKIRHAEEKDKQERIDMANNLLEVRNIQSNKRVG
ncbi:MAG: hypothetical protein MK193_12690 [Lentisphaeria bacterium]|nr:hypothetical protein [Lentisphaeria bacterium]